MKTRLEMNQSKAMLFLLLLTVAAISHIAQNTNTPSVNTTLNTSINR